jgi:hypothetical protein
MGDSVQMNPTAPIPEPDNERRTPVAIVEAARKVLGVINTDPATDEEANLVIQARYIFTKQDQGLDQAWYGQVFLNPPGGKIIQSGAGRRPVSSAAVWWAKLLSEVVKGHTTEAIFVCFNLEAMLNTQRFGPLPIQAFTFCVPAKRLKYPSANGSKSKSPPGASAIVYVGDKPEKFGDYFNPFGYVRQGCSLRDFRRHETSCN